MADQLFTGQLLAKDRGIPRQMQKILAVVRSCLTAIYFHHDNLKERMQRKGSSTIRCAFLAAIVISISACSFPGVYKINIQQGNIITQDMLDKLKPGMNRRQVHFALGNPVMDNTFDDQIEYYLYTYQKAGGETVQQNILVYFDGNSYLRYEGKPLPENPAY